MYLNVQKNIGDQTEHQNFDLFSQNKGIFA